MKMILHESGEYNQYKMKMPTYSNATEKEVEEATSDAKRDAFCANVEIIAEEDEDGNSACRNTAQKKEVKAVENDNLAIAMQEVKEAKCENELAKIWGRWLCFQTDNRFVSAVSARKKEVPHVA